MRLLITARSGGELKERWNGLSATDRHIYVSLSLGMGKGTCNQDWRIYPWTKKQCRNNMRIFRCMYICKFRAETAPAPAVMVISKSPLVQII
jgi:hypothetical protein